MKRLFTLVLTLFVLQSFAQTNFTNGGAASGALQPSSAVIAKQSSQLPDTTRKASFRKNVVKVNLTSLVLFNNYSLSYERSLTRKITLVAGYSAMPETKLASMFLVERHTPFVESTAERFVGEEVDITNYLNLATLGSNSLTGEVRFYGGTKPGARGFYLSLYGRYMNLKAAYPYEYETADSRVYTLPFNGTLRGFGGGAMLGYQLMIAKRVTVDMYILGGHYGKLKADIPAMTDLSTMTENEKRELREDIQSVNESTNGKIDAEATVTDQGVNLKGSLPIAGIRSFGFNLGLAF